MLLVLFYSMLYNRLSTIAVTLGCCCVELCFVSVLPVHVYSITTARVKSVLAFDCVPRATTTVLHRFPHTLISSMCNSAVTAATLQATQTEASLAHQLDLLPGLRAEAQQETARAALLEREIGTPHSTL
jgi:hypothetical protein